MKRLVKRLIPIVVFMMVSTVALANTRIDELVAESNELAQRKAQAEQMVQQLTVRLIEIRGAVTELQKLEKPSVIEQLQGGSNPEEE